MKQKVYGDAIGSFLGKTIFETIEQDQNKYVFDRIAEMDDDGIPLNQLREDEVLFVPGLIYRMAG